MSNGKGFLYYLGMTIAVIGAVIFIGAVLANLVYVPRTNLVTECTYEIQHIENGPICQKLHNINAFIGNWAMVGLVLFFVFLTTAWYSERRRLRKR